MCGKNLKNWSKNFKDWNFMRQIHQSKPKGLLIISISFPIYEFLPNLSKLIINYIKNSQTKRQEIRRQAAAATIALKVNKSPNRTKQPNKSRQNSTKETRLTKWEKERKKRKIKTMRNAIIKQKTIIKSNRDNRGGNKAGYDCCTERHNDGNKIKQWKSFFVRFWWQKREEKFFVWRKCGKIRHFWSFLFKNLPQFCFNFWQFCIKFSFNFFI